MKRHGLLLLRTAVLPLTLLSGCAVVGYPAGAPRGPLGPTAEARSRYGNPVSYEQFGETYFVMEHALGYEEEGVASWYGEEFAGRRTSSGEPFDPDELTAAHRTLPLPTRVEVTNLDNGRKVVVRINDRGPFAHTADRIIDVSEAAARELGMIGPGTARVRVRALTSPEGRPGG